jgi:hypothetical protein
VFFANFYFKQFREHHLNHIIRDHALNLTACIHPCNFRKDEFRKTSATLLHKWTRAQAQLPHSVSGNTGGPITKSQKKNVGYRFLKSKEAKTKPLYYVITVMSFTLFLYVRAFLW